MRVIDLSVEPLSAAQLLDMARGELLLVKTSQGDSFVVSPADELATEARIDIEESLVVTADHDSELVLIDVPSCKGWGYDRETLRGQKT